MAATDGADRAMAVPLTAVNLPLLGSRTAPAATFQYLLQEIDAAGATFACPGWLVRRESFRPGDSVDLHVPFLAPDGWHRHQAEIVTAAVEAEHGGQVCRAEFRGTKPLHHPVFATVERGEIRFRASEGETLDRDQLLVTLLRDCMLQKRGIGVYFKHLVPLFSRITLFPAADFGALRAMLLEDVRRRIEQNIASFEGWHEQARTGAWSAATLSRDLDLETVRAAVEPEIESDLFDATFDAPTIRPYLAAIRLLEQKLYLNYNTLVLLFAQAL